MRRLVLLGLADIYGVEALGGISEEEKVWLEHVMKIDRARLPKKMQANLPDWLYNRLVAQYGEDETLRLASVLNTPASLDLRVNTLKAKREDVLTVLKEVPVECEPTPYASSGIRLHRKIALQNMPLFKEGNVEVQDEGSQLLAQIVGAKRGEMVVDFCAGAGGKTLALGPSLFRNFFHKLLLENVFSRFRKWFGPVLILHTFPQKLPMRLSVNSRHTHDEGYIHWLPHKPLLFAEKPDKLFLYCHQKLLL